MSHEDSHRSHGPHAVPRDLPDQQATGHGGPHEAPSEEGAREQEDRGGVESEEHGEAPATGVHPDSPTPHEPTD